MPRGVDDFASLRLALGNFQEGGAPPPVQRQRFLLVPVGRPFPALCRPSQPLFRIEIEYQGQIRHHAIDGDRFQFAAEIRQAAPVSSP